MPKKTKVDCVAIQHRGGAAVSKVIRKMTREEEARYWAQQTAEFKAELAAAREARRKVAQ